MSRSLEHSSFFFLFFFFFFFFIYFHSLLFFFSLKLSKNQSQGIVNFLLFGSDNPNQHSLFQAYQYRANASCVVWGVNTRVVIRGTSSKKSQQDFVPSTHPGTHELVLSTEKQ